MWQLIRQQQSFQMQCILNPHIYTGNRALRVTGGKGGRFIQRFHGASGQLDVVRPCDLETWLTNHGGVVDGAKLHTQRQPDGRACRRLEATKDIKPGSCIISVPRVAQIRWSCLLYMPPSFVSARCAYMKHNAIHTMACHTLAGHAPCLMFQELCSYFTCWCDARIF